MFRFSLHLVNLGLTNPHCFHHCFDYQMYPNLNVNTLWNCTFYVVDVSVFVEENFVKLLQQGNLVRGIVNCSGAAQSVV